MKIKLFNGNIIVLELKVMAGGYDTEAGRVSLMVHGVEGQAGTVQFDVAEARKVAGMLTATLPEVTRVN